MKKKTLQKIFFASIVVAILSNCAAFTMSNKGLIALKEQIIPIASQSNITESWQTKDVLVSYSTKSSSSSFTISGSMQIADSVLGSFPLSESFNLYLTFVDSSGMGLSTHDIGPLFPYRTEVPKQLNINKTLVRPAGAVSFVFSYSGHFVGDVGGGGSGTDWDISFRPFSKAH